LLRFVIRALDDAFAWEGDLDIILQPAIDKYA
jgi:hypothetical protein